VSDEVRFRSVIELLSLKRITLKKAKERALNLV
jgi:hypothetical protein